MAEILTERPNIGISACVYSCPVRYNGKAFDALGPIGREKGDFVFTPVCPEVMAGLGVPRMPIHLTGPGQDVLTGDAVVKSRRGWDVSDALIAGCTRCIETLEEAGVEAFIVKEASPSCGVFKARIGKRRQEQVTGSGVFGAMLLERGWFLIPDEALQSPLKWWDWRRRLHAWLWLKRRELSTKRDLYDTWHVVKFIVQELDRPFADEMGRRLAGLGKRVSRAEMEDIRTEMMDALRKPSTPARITQALWKSYVHHKKKGRLEGVDLHELTVRSPEVRRNVTTIAAELTKLERVEFENDLLFGQSPVIYRDRRRLPKKPDA
jgi:uncharacterized protein YbbK (DUF523 family)